MVLHQLMHIVSTTEWKPKMFKSRHPKSKMAKFPCPKESKWKISNPIKAYHDPHHLDSGVYPLGWGIYILINWSWRVNWESEITHLDSMPLISSNLQSVCCWVISQCEAFLIIISHNSSDVILRISLELSQFQKTIDEDKTFHVKNWFIFSTVDSASHN